MVADLDKKLATWLVTQVPPGSGPEARLGAMAALADVLGMYLGGDLAKLGRATYLARAQELMDRVAGNAEVSAVQLRPHGRPALVGFQPAAPEAFTSPPAEFGDPEGRMMILLSAMGVGIDPEAPGWWALPGWPGARAVLAGDGIQIVVFDKNGNPSTSWLVTELQQEGK